MWRLLATPFLASQGSKLLLHAQVVRKHSAHSSIAALIEGILVVVVVKVGTGVFFGIRQNGLVFGLLALLFLLDLRCH